jgi:hypothetical protein
VSDSIPNILLKAAEVIELNGWTQNDWYASVGTDDLDVLPAQECPVCAAGAINVAADHVPDFDEPEGNLREALEAFARHIDPEIGSVLDEFADEADLFSSIGDWNDTSAGSAEDVITALRECAASLKAGA